jgi:hypothetical protein
MRMSLQIHRPRAPLSRHADIPDGERLIYLAGPIEGAVDWQAEAVKVIDGDIPRDRRVHIANPRWTNIPRSRRLGPDEQLTWNKRYYRRAAWLGAHGAGAVVVWVVPESEPRPEPYPRGYAYAEETRATFAELLGMQQTSNGPINIALGIHPMYEGDLRGYQHAAQELDITIHDSLVNVCRAATALILR